MMKADSGLPALISVGQRMWANRYFEEVLSRGLWTNISNLYGKIKMSLELAFSYLLCEIGCFPYSLKT